MKTQATLSAPSAVPGSPLLQVSGALFGIIAFILIAAWLAKRFGLAGKTAATQINEMTLSFIPKIIAVFVAIIVAGPWMLNLLLDYMRNLFTNLPYIIG